MPKNTSVTLGDHFDGFIAEQISAGRYHSASEVVRAGLRALEEDDTRLQLLRNALIKGEESGFVDYSYTDFIAELDADG